MRYFKEKDILLSKVLILLSLPIDEKNMHEGMDVEKEDDN